MVATSSRARAHAREMFSTFPFSLDLITSRMLEHYGASVSEVADNTEARSQ